jgi:signal transduction histidine kinase/tetratricopeptide (TPR) repeat protein
MGRNVTQGPSIEDRVRIDRELTRHGTSVTSVGRDLVSDLDVVIKELSAESVRAFPPADPKRSVWTRLTLPWQIDRSGQRVRLLRPYLEGDPLDRSFERGPSSVEWTIGIALDLFRALDTLHGLGIVHGAVKPANVIVGTEPGGRAWLVDPSITDPATGSPAPDITVGTARYFSPEQAGALNDRVDSRSDLYSAGIVLFECLTGRPLHDVGDTGELLRAHLLHPSTSVRAAGVTVPRALDEIVGRLLRKDPRDRYASAAGVLQDLQELQRAVDRGDRDPVLVIGASDDRATVTDPAFVGRTGELAEIDRILDRGEVGRGTLVRLEAGSGDGKTRFLDEISLMAAQRRALVLRAEARDLEAPKPSTLLEGLASSIVDAAATDAGFADHLRRSLGAWAPELRTVVPELAGILRTASDERDEVSDNRLTAALAALFDALGTPERAAVLLLDDCQWADELSLSVVDRWSRNPPAMRSTTVIAALRNDEIRPDHPSRSWSRASTITLRPLDETVTRQLVTTMAGRVPDEANAVIHRVSRGRPFFVTSALRGMVESNALRPAPGGWQMDPDALASLSTTGKAAMLITRQLGRLPDETLAFLSAAAIFGRHASVAEAATLAGVDTGRVGAIVDDGRRAGLIWSAEPGGISFIHDKVREGALGRLSGAERRLLHLAAAELIERERRADVFDLAYHFDEGGESGRALPAAIEAAALARGRHALETAEAMYRIAARGVDPSHREQRAHLAQELGEVLMLRGAYDDAAIWFDEARGLARSGPEAAAIQARIGELAFKRGDVRTAADAITQALAMIGRRVPTAGLVLVPLFLWELVVQALHSLVPSLFVGRRPLDGATVDLLASRFHGRLGYAWWFERGKIATLWTHLRSLNLAERYPPTSELAQAYSEHAPAMMLIPWHRRGIRFAQRSHAIRVQLGDLWGQGQSLHFWGAGLYAASQYRASLERMREAHELLERTGDRWELNNCTLQMAMAMYRLGDLAGAVEHSRLARQSGLEIGDAQARGIGLEGWAKATDGRLPEGVIRSELERSHEDVLTVGSVLQAEGVRLLASDDPVAAIGSFEEGQRRFRQAGMKNAGVSPVRPWLLTALRRAAEAEPAVARRRRRAHLRRARRVARQATRRARFYRNDLPHVLRERAHLAALSGRRRRAHRLFDRSLDVAIRQQAAAEALRTRIARGTVGEALGWAVDVEDGGRARRELDALLASTGQAVPSRGRATLSLVDRFDTLLTHGRRIASSLRPDVIEDESVEAARVLLRAERTRILRVGASLEARDASTSEVVEHPVVREALEQLTVVTRSAAHEGSALAAPILVRGRPVACLFATHPEVSTLFGEDEERLIEFVCTLSGAALENAEGFDEVRSLTRMLERRVAERTAELAGTNQALTESMAQLERANEELRDLDRMKDEFVSMVTHELRTPLTSVVGFASTLLEIPGEIPPEELRRCVEIIERQSRRLTRLVENLLQLSRLDRGAVHVSMASYDVRDLLERALEEIEARGTVSIACAPGVRVLTDPDCFTQIVLNLLSNAHRHGAPPIAIEVRPVDRTVEVAVADGGTGVPSSFIPHLFDRFAQAEAGRATGGIGLGLAIVASLAADVGASVRYEPNRPRGARFVLRLPAAR